MNTFDHTFVRLDKERQDAIDRKRAEEERSNREEADFQESVSQAFTGFARALFDSFVKSARANGYAAQLADNVKGLTTTRISLTFVPEKGVDIAEDGSNRTTFSISADSRTRRVTYISVVDPDNERSEPKQEYGIQSLNPEQVELRLNVFLEKALKVNSQKIK